jgi:hypothetical protein
VICGASILFNFFADYDFIGEVLFELDKSFVSISDFKAVL